MKALHLLDADLFQVKGRLGCKDRLDLVVQQVGLLYTVRTYLSISFRNRQPWLSGRQFFLDRITVSLYLDEKFPSDQSH